MADLLTPTHPLERFRVPFAALTAELGADRLRLALEPDTAAGAGAALTLRLPAAGAALWAVSDALGGPLPVEPQAWSPLAPPPALRSDARSRAYRLGPDEWLVTAPAADPGAARDQESRLAAVLRHHGGSATDVSAQRTSLHVGGADARDLLAFGCSLDLRPRVFGPGACAQTVVWQAPTLLAADEEGMQLLVRTSFARHLAGRLLDAAQELRRDPTLPLT